MKRPNTYGARSVVGAIFAFAAIASADARDRHASALYPDSLEMTCAQAQQYIVKNDGATRATGGAWASFHSSYCSGQPAYVRTKDGTFCFVGQYCDCETTYCSQSYFQGTER
jgi:hypothetical protein